MSEFIALQNSSQVAILLCAHLSNFEIFIQCPSFTNLLAPFVDIEISEYEIDSKNIHLQAQNIHFFKTALLLQATILAQCSTQDSNLFKNLFPIFMRFNAAHIITQNELEVFAHLASWQDTPPPISSTQIQSNQQSSSPKALGEEFLALSTQLRILLEEESQHNLDSILYKFSHQHFSIAVTGVLSAGKSTFLNALLSKEILGSSSVPETANLTLLRYGEHAKAKVHFWSKEQWEELRTAGSYDSTLSQFVTQSEAHFGTRLQEFIASPHHVQDIDIDELHTYTSANDKSKLCNLVREVELFVPLEFLRHNVEIVDTPGLDDPITKREDITRDFIARCDMLIHVMNASCAATQVDIDFILESLLERNIARLLIVLTRIDLLSEQELQSSLNYTKQSLIAQLRKAHFDGDIEALIRRIDFIPLAGYAALLHRTNRAKDFQGKELVSLEECGIIQLESYLHTMLLGEDSIKARDSLYIALKAVLKLALHAHELTILESKLLGANKEQLESLIAQEKEENKALLASLETFEMQCTEIQDKLAIFLESLHTNSQHTLSKIAQTLQDKIYEDIMYMNQSGLNKEIASLKTMIELELKDCFVDIGREYRYMLGGHITEITNSQALRELSEQHDVPSMPTIHFQLAPNEVAHITQNVAHTLPQIQKLQSARLKNALSSLFEDIFIRFATIIKEHNNTIQTEFMTYFASLYTARKALIQSQIQSKQASLESALKMRERSDSKALQERLKVREIDICNAINTLKRIMKELQ